MLKRIVARSVPNLPRYAAPIAWLSVRGDAFMDGPRGRMDVHRHRPRAGNDSPLRTGSPRNRYLMCCAVEEYALRSVGPMRRARRGARG